MNAVLVTCDRGRERRCEREILNYFNEWWETKEAELDSADNKKQASAVDKHQSVSSSLEAELAELRSQEGYTMCSVLYVICLKPDTTIIYVCMY